MEITPTPDRFGRDAEEVLDGVRLGPDPYAPGYLNWSPCAEVGETDDAYRIALALPGAAAADVALGYADGALDVRGRVRLGADAGPVPRARDGVFRRRIALGDPVDVRAARARLDRGVLTVLVRKASARGPAG